MSIQDSERFFLVGDGKIKIQNTKTGLQADVNLFNANGKLNEKALEQINQVFKLNDRLEVERISLRLIFLLDYFSDKLAPGKTIYLTSGYRSPRYNLKLRKGGGNVAATSAHIDGMALDFYLEGIDDGKIIWETVRKENCCGIGYYGGASVHLDSGRPRFWEASTSKTRTSESEFNRKIYLSTEYDRYRKSEKIRLSLSFISDFPFGIRRTAVIFDSMNNTFPLIINSAEEECLIINNRTKARSIVATPPPQLDAGRYKIRLEFCKRPFEQMPASVTSNEIEIVEE